MRVCHQDVRSKSAITLIELLVVVVVIGLLVALLLPAVQEAREAARRARCVSNLKQLMLAVGGFESARGGFPADPAFREVAPWPLEMHYRTVPYQLLPYLEQRPLYDGINQDVFMDALGSFPPENVTAALTEVSAFLCPSDPSDPLSPSRINYRTNRGLVLPLPDQGAFGFFGRILPVSGFRDGLSQTVAFSEKKVGSMRGARYDPTRDWINVSSIPEPGGPDGWAARCAAISSPSIARLDAGYSWLFHGAFYTNFFCSVTPNSRIPDCGGITGNGTGIFAARSGHPGGVNAAMADGSVRWVSSTIALSTWRAMGTRNGGEVVNPD